MNTVGAMLRTARLEKGLTIPEAERVTKIRAKFLEGIESDDYSAIPSISYAKGFVKNYSEYLGLDSGKVLAFFRRQTTDISKSSLLPNKEIKGLNTSRFQLTPGRFSAFLVLSMAILFLGYLGLQYRQINQPPHLAIDTPEDQLVTQDNRIDVMGTTDTDATVIINGVSVLVRGDGKFFETVQLTKGVNKITISATSKFGKTTQIVREVGVQPVE